MRDRKPRGARRRGGAVADCHYCAPDVSHSLESQPSTLNYELSPMALDETFARGFVHELEILRLRSVPAFARDGTPLPMNLPHLQRRSASWARQERRASSRRPTARAAVKALNLSKGAKLSRWAHRTPPPCHIFERLRRSRQSAAGSSPLLCTSPGSSRTKYHARGFGPSG